MIHPCNLTDDQMTEYIERLLVDYYQLIDQVDPYVTPITIVRSNGRIEKAEIDIDAIPSGGDIELPSGSTIRLNDPQTIELFTRWQQAGIPTQSIQLVEVEFNGRRERGYEFVRQDNGYNINSNTKIFNTVAQFDSINNWNQLLTNVKNDVRAIGIDNAAIYWGLTIKNGIRFSARVPDSAESANLADKIKDAMDYIGDRDLGNLYWKINRGVIGAVIKQFTGGR